jgi:hypothetical protein
MSHEVCAQARFPGRARLVLGAVLAFALGLVIWRWPVFARQAPDWEPFEAAACEAEVLPARCERVLPLDLRVLPSPSIVEQTCLTALARGLMDHPGMEIAGDTCGEELLHTSFPEQDVPRATLLAFAGQLSGWEPLLFAPAEDLEQERLRSSALAEAAWSAKRVAGRYRAVRGAHLAQEFREFERSAQQHQEGRERQQAIARAGRSVQQWLVAMLGAA